MESDRGQNEFPLFALSMIPYLRTVRMSNVSFRPNPRGAGSEIKTKRLSNSLLK